jgi:hypothetical protein
MGRILAASLRVVRSRASRTLDGTGQHGDGGALRVAGVVRGRIIDVSRDGVVRYAALQQADSSCAQEC